MKNKTILICMSAAVFVTIIGITACDTNNRSAKNSIAGTDDLTQSPATANPGGQTSSAAFTMEVGSSNSNFNLESDNTNTTENLTFDAYSANRMNVTGALQISTNSEGTATNPQRINPVYRAYRDVPQNISYNGYSTISFNVGGNSYSASLNNDERNMLNNLQQKLDEAQTFGNNDDGGITPVQSTVADSKKQETKKPLEAMTEQEIKSMLKDHGYKVKKLGNRHFQVIRKYNKGHGTDKAMSITSIFNANTGRMEPSYTTSKNGKLLSKHLNKKDKKSGKHHDKTKIKRKKGEYLLLDITQKENN